MLITRRTTLTLAAAAAASALLKPHVARAATPFEQPPLPYVEDALAPQISARTVALHYGKHHKGYFDKLNQLVPGTPYAEMDLEEVVKTSKKDGQDKVFNQAGLEPRLLLGAVQRWAGCARGRLCRSGRPRLRR